MSLKPVSTSVPEPAPFRISETGLWDRLRARTADWAVSIGITADQAVVSLASFVSTAIVGRACGQHELGVYGLAVSIFWLAAGIPNSLVWTPYLSRANRLPAARRTIFAGSTLAHSLAVGLLLASVILLFGFLPIPSIASNSWFAPMCIALAPFTIMMIVREHIRRINLTHLRIRELLAIDVPIGVVQLALLLGLAYLGALSAATALLAIAVSCGGAVVWLAREREQFCFVPARAALHWGYNLRFGRWLLCVSLLWLVADSSYRWMVVMLHGTSSLGQFAAAQNIVLVLNPILLTVTNLTQAMSANRLAEGGFAALRQMVVRSTILLAFWSGVALIAVAAIGGHLVEFVFGPAYAGLGPVVATLCIGMFARIVAMPIDGAMIALQRGRLLVVASAVRLMSIVGAGIPLIAWRGLEGVGYAMAISAVAGAAIQWWAFMQGSHDAQR